MRDARPFNKTGEHHAERSGAAMLTLVEEFAGVGVEDQMGGGMRGEARGKLFGRRAHDPRCDVELDAAGVVVFRGRVGRAEMSWFPGRAARPARRSRHRAGCTVRPAPGRTRFSKQGAGRSMDAAKTPRPAGGDARPAHPALAPPPDPQDPPRPIAPGSSPLPRTPPLCVRDCL